MKDHEGFPPLLIERGEGSYLIDYEGRRYLDTISSWWVNLFGHNNPRLNSALRSQLEKIAHVMFAGITHRPAVDLADSLIRLTPPNLTRVFFSDNGSTSVEVALKMSAQYWQLLGRKEKVQFAYLRGAYHGETLGALSVCGIELFRDKFSNLLLDQVEVSGPDCLRCPYNEKPESCNAECFSSMEVVLEKTGETLAGIIVEPLVQGAVGMKMYPKVYLRKLQLACDERDIHVVYDEVAVGFGRTGALFVCESLGLRPTFLCLSKGITSGYLPLAATLVEEKIFEAFYGEYSDFKMFLHSHSYTANPLACACANETLAMLTEDGFLESLQPKIKFLEDYGSRLRELPHCGEFRRTGLIGRLELVRDKKTLEPIPIQERVGYRIYLEALQKGVFLRPLGNVIYFIPPLIIDVDQIKTMIDTAYESVRKILGDSKYV
tara:strand:+ start:2013 stop:3314 length:1302 start_codon:yes stop_codon:yes gene_type:complete